MSQARVTDFFSHRKRSSAAPVKGTKPRTRASSTRTTSAKTTDPVLCPSAVHEEFIRLIDEAAAPSPGESAGARAPSCPRSPKRSSAAGELRLGAAAAAPAPGAHSPAKKRREEAAAPERRRRKTTTTARKKLCLPQAEQTGSPGPETAQTSGPEPTQTSGPEPAQISGPEPTQTSGPEPTKTSGPAATRPQQNTQGATGKVLSKEELKVLSSRIQRIRKHAEETTRAPSLPGPSSPPAHAKPASAPPPASDPTPVAPAPVCDVTTLQRSVSRAKQLVAAAALRRNQKLEGEQTEAPPVDSAVALPAYQRYQSLSEATPPGLSLPYQYRILLEMFRSLDTVVAMMFNRHETSTFTKVQQGVQDMTRKRFELSHLAQIQTVSPDAFSFRQEKNVPGGGGAKRSRFQLTLEPRLTHERSEAAPVLSASRLLERRRVFHQNLVQIVKRHHKEFLSALVPPVSVPDDKLTRWHPRFNVDLVPAVSCSALPQPPQTERLTTAREVLDKARSLITPKMEKALESLTVKMESGEVSDPAPAPAPPQAPQETSPPEAVVPVALKGVSQSLLDRIRAKEAQKLQAAMTRNPVQEERLLMMSRLGELARILRNVFVAEKKAALLMELACSRMVASYRSALSTGEMERHLRLLAELAADWLTIHQIRKDSYLKLNKTMELGAVLDKLGRRLKDEERL